MNWDAPYIISPHNPRRLYWASNYVYRTDDRGDSWTRISPDLSRSLDAFNVPIMGKVWPRDSVALNTSTTPLSNVVSLDESPLLEGLVYAGTDDGLLQITDDGGKNWRKVEDFPGVPKWTYVSDVFASPRDADTVFVTLNNWQRGDYKPYVVRSSDRGRTWTNITGNLPEKHDVWTIVQDHANGNLLFVGTEFAVFVSVDAGRQWTPLSGGMPPIQVRDMTIQRRETDLVLATFGRGFYILDDYSALREITPAVAGRRRAALPAARRLSVQPARALAGRIRGARPAVGPVDRAEPAVRCGLHLQRQGNAARRRRARVDDHRRRRPADQTDGHRQDRGAAPGRVEPARRAAGNARGRRAAVRARAAAVAAHPRAPW